MTHVTKYLNIETYIASSYILFVNMLSLVKGSSYHTKEPESLLVNKLCAWRLRSLVNYLTFFSCEATEKHTLLKHFKLI